MHPSGIFNRCVSLEEVDLSGWQTGSLKDLAYAFCGCTSLKRIDLSGWDVSDVTDFGMMFYDCESLEEVKLDGWCFSGSGAKSLRQMFNGCRKLSKIQLEGIHPLDLCRGKALSNCNRLKNVCVKSPMASMASF